MLPLFLVFNLNYTCGLVGKTYPSSEYGLAALMSFGVMMFMFSKSEGNNKNIEDMSATSTSMSGVILLVGYMLFDRYVD